MKLQPHSACDFQKRHGLKRVKTSTITSIYYKKTTQEKYKVTKRARHRYVFNYCLPEAEIKIKIAEGGNLEPKIGRYR